MRKYTAYLDVIWLKWCRLVLKKYLFTLHITMCLNTKYQHNIIVPVIYHTIKYISTT